MSGKAGRVPAGREERNGAQAPEIDPKAASFQLRLAYSPIHRWGIYAGELIPKGRKIIEYTGEKISRRETKRRYEEREEKGAAGRSTLTIVASRTAIRRL